MAKINDDDETARAVAEIENELNSFKSPLGMVGGEKYNDVDIDNMDWYQQVLKEESPVSVKTPERTPLLERAGTPVMSNSSSSKNLKGLPAHDKNNDNAVSNINYDRFMEPLPIQTPMTLKHRFKSVPSPNLLRGGVVGGDSSLVAVTNKPRSITFKQYTFRKYHDALLAYVRSKHSLNRRIDLDHEEQVLDQKNGNNDDSMDISPTITSESLSRQERAAEVDFCQALSRIGYLLPTEDMASTEQGHFWNLLLVLRKLGQSALIWDDDSTSSTQHSSSQAFYVQQLTTKASSTSKELLDTMNQTSSVASPFVSDKPPLVLQRKYELLHWIQLCMQIESKYMKDELLSSATSNNGSITIQSYSHPDDPSLTSQMSEMDKKTLKMTMQVCLVLILEGRTSKALEIARSRGQSYRAATWIGGEPFGYTSVVNNDTKSIDHIPVGNPNRFLWKRQVWKSGRRLLQNQKTQKPFNTSDVRNEEAAIYSILADDVATTLKNPCIRSSWTKSLCALLLGIRGRTQDEVLHRQNNLRRNIGYKGFPGCQYKEEENEQLAASANLSKMTEAQIVSTLKNSVFLNQQEDQKQDMGIGPHCRFLYKSAILAFFTGKSAILQFCSKETTRLLASIDVSLFDNDGNDCESQDWNGIRFITHLMLFLDSLQDSSAPIILDGVGEQKNKILFVYVQYLESRPDLWNMMTLYVSFLPEAKIEEYFPSFLVKISDNSERKKVTEQIRELIPSLQLSLLRRVVRLSLSASSGSVLGGSDRVMDKIKCDSLQWLLHHDEHMGDALICANILLRDFLLNEKEDKTHAATIFMSTHLPENFIDLANQSLTELVRSDDASENSNIVSIIGMAQSVYLSKINNASAEYMAFMSYLDAFGSFKNWKRILQTTPTSLDGHHLPNATNLNETEENIANSNFHRCWIKEKKKHLNKTLAAAEAARSSLYNVLTHPGGWLSTDDEDFINIHVDDEEEQKRQQDIERIRSRHLVLAVNLYHQVCEETAMWLSRSLSDIENIHLPRKEVLQLLQQHDDPGNTISFTPSIWHQKALDLATVVASDAHGISKAYPPNDLRDLLAKLGETAISKLMYV